MRRKIIFLILAISIVFFYLGARAQLHKMHLVNIEARTMADFQAIETNLGSYNQLYGHLPSTEEGLDILVHKPPNTGATWYQFFDRIPIDPWGHPYRYRLTSEKSRGYDVLSLGPDGLENTKDDIHLK